MKSPPGIIRNQPVAEVKLTMARKMRQEMTPAEAALWAKLRDRQIAGAKFRRQQVIAGFIANFYCHEAALAVEVDGATHEAQHDAERDAVIAAKGITTLRFTNQEVQHNMEAVIQRLRAILKPEASNSNTKNKEKVLP